MQMHRLDHRQAYPMAQLRQAKAGMGPMLEALVRRMMETLPDAEYIEITLTKYEADDGNEELDPEH
jgi:hypothetical protein